jgi:multiple antibiotic resistance protein
MDTTTIDAGTVVDVFLLLLIGVGPKIVLLPFLDLTADLGAEAKGRVVRTMLTTAAVVALILVVFGELLRKLLHFSTGALAISGGILLMIIAVNMVAGQGGNADGNAGGGSTEADPRRLAMFPLAIPYLLNPAGIVVLVTASAEATSPGDFALVLALVAAVLVLDAVVLRSANRVSAHLDPARMLVTEKVFGILLAALAVQLALNGLADVGVIHSLEH